MADAAQVAMLALQQVSVDIAGIPVLRRVSVALAAGRTYALVGRNGAGKTTLLRTLMGFVPPREGRITLAGQDLLAEPAHRRAALGIGYAPEERVLFPTMTVLENLRLPAEALGLPAAEIAARLEQTLAVVPQVREMLPRSAAALSGGQGKMAALARQYAEALSRLHTLRPELCLLITESNRALLDRIDCQTLTLERGALDTGLATQPTPSRSLIP